MTQNIFWAPTIFLYSSGPYQPIRTSFRPFSTLKRQEFHFSQNKDPSDAKIGKIGVFFCAFSGNYPAAIYNSKTDSQGFKTEKSSWF
jgi:hypothetical protein